MKKFRIYRTRTFTRWMRKAGVREEELRLAICEMANGLVEADLGGHLYKKRIRLPGQGKRSGGRVIVASHWRDRWFFLYGFAKNERSDLTDGDLKALRELATTLLALSDSGIRRAKAEGLISEVMDEQQS